MFYKRSLLLLSLLIILGIVFYAAQGYLAEDKTQETVYPTIYSEGEKQYFTTRDELERSILRELNHIKKVVKILKRKKNIIRESKTVDNEISVAVAQLNAVRGNFNKMLNQVDTISADKFQEQNNTLVRQYNQLRKKVSNILSSMDTETVARLRENSYLENKL